MAVVLVRTAETGERLAFVVVLDEDVACCTEFVDWVALVEGVAVDLAEGTGGDGNHRSI